MHIRLDATVIVMSGRTERLTTPLILIPAAIKNGDILADMYVCVC